MTFADAARRAWALAARLGWTPSIFWESTPQELADVFADGTGVNGPSRDDMDALMARFPDEE